MRAAIKKLDWNITVTSTTVTAAMTFKDFDQSQRFVGMLIKFIQDEREASDILPEVAWYCPPSIARM